VTRNLADRLQARLEQPLTDGAVPARVTSVAAAIWMDVDATFSPLIGKLGVAALFRRAVALTSREFPWLTAALDEQQPGEDFAGLRQAFCVRSGADIASANAALLGNFFTTLTDLIGVPLTERLLASIADIPSTGHPPETTTT
jgi:hypothetical protein